MTLCVIFLRFYLVRQNKAKDRILQEQGLDPRDPGLVHAFEDRTDQEKLSFRYMY